MKGGYRRRSRAEVVQIWLAFGGTLVAFGGVLLFATDDSPLRVLAIALILCGGYVFLHLIVPWLPLYEPRRRAALSSEAALPEFLSGRGQLNSLISRGETLLRMIPGGETPNAVVQALSSGPRVESYFKLAAEWEALAWDALGRYAPSLTSLFNHDLVPSMTYDGIRAHLRARIDELREVLGKL
jgi:hypothetical protein